MAVLEIQANGDTAVSKEAIDHAGQLLEDPLMRVKDFKRMFITYISYELLWFKTNAFVSYTDRNLSSRVYSQKPKRDLQLMTCCSTECYLRSTP